MKDDGNKPEMNRKKRLNDAQCKATAATIYNQQQTYAFDFERYSKCNLQGGYPGKFIPIWPADPEACKAKINHLFHPGEAAIIIENLTA